MKNNIYRSAAQVTAFSTVEKALSFVYRIILTRIIGAEGIGIYQICLTVFAVFLTVASSGVPVTVSRLMAKSNAKNDLNGKHSAVTAGVVCTLAITVPIALILFIGRNAFGFLFSDERCVQIFIILLPGLVITSVYAVIRGSFWGNKQFLPYSVIELLEDALMVGAGIWLIWGVTDPLEGARNATIAVLISYVFSFVASLFWYFKKGGKFVNPKKQLKPLISSAAPITAMRTATSLLNSTVSVLMPALLISACGYGNSEALATYGVVMGMAVPLLFAPSALIGSIAVVVAPELSENYYRKREKAVRYDVEKTVKASMFIATVLIPILFVLGNAVSVFLFDNEFCGELVQRCSFIVLPLCVAMITNTVLNSMNCEKRTLLYFCIGAGAMIISVLFLTRYLGVYSYGLGLALSNIICATLNLRLLRKKCPGINYIKYALHSILVIVASCLFGWLFNGIISNYVAPGWQILICTPLILGFTIGMLYCLEMVSANPFKKLFARKSK
ncbi:MAG: oligosaccharide flippase family protein [Clostridia bacterium]|nr:oligosaccharide flippase family protein [Clostridia bacterium]